MAIKSTVSTGKRKGIAYNDMSNKRCVDCGKPLKRRLVERQGHDRCYVCHKLRNGVVSATYHKKNGVLKVVDYVKKQEQQQHSYKSN